MFAVTYDIILSQIYDTVYLLWLSAVLLKVKVTLDSASFIDILFRREVLKLCH